MRNALQGLLLATLLAGIPISHAAETVLFQSRSSFNTLIVSEDERGLRVLRFEPDGARQSVVKPGDPDHLEVMYAKAFPAVLAWMPAPKRALVVGLGGGTVPMFLRKRLPDLEIDVVELDPAVIEVARRHFGFVEDAKLRAFADDGRRFIEKKKSAYDIILLDAFGANEAPYSLSTVEFQRSVRRALTPRGVVVGNMWSGISNPIFSEMVRTYIESYRSVSILGLDGVSNKLVIGCPWSPAPDKAEIVRLSREIGAKLEMRDDLAGMVERGLRAPSPEETAASVLSDNRPPRRKR